MYGDPSEASIGQPMLLIRLTPVKKANLFQMIFNPKAQDLPLNVVYDCGNIERYAEAHNMSNRSTDLKM